MDQEDGALFNVDDLLLPNTPDLTMSTGSLSVNDTSMIQWDMDLAEMKMQEDSVKAPPAANPELEEPGLEEVDEFSEFNDWLQSGVVDILN